MGLVGYLFSFMGMMKMITGCMALLGAILVQTAINVKINWDLQYFHLYQPLQFTAASGYIIFSYHAITFFIYGAELDRKFSWMQSFNWEKIELLCCCGCCAFALIGGVTGIAVAVKDKNQEVGRVSFL
ncbi:Oidioi.mRNA.OKI2018_I69.chr2.g5340.t1.cds [Oikopleura dioica]|uniref:Oidioi.mRNA.OKI2018_I69.chr2.g5340.t1.cds n=1 Tax=Oikopleura dioica TaxID=34765 RepID=A0ABN7T0K3_OIKDI|nr:Oidioi.mRNA.OKI2018_I69.chr2.g5340.t1.cds [Oikopleura dioica]